MKHLSCLLFSLAMVLPTKGSNISHEEALTDYVQRLNTHSWEQIAPVMTDSVVLIFTEGSFVGKEAAKAAFEKTFNLIKEEHYSIHNVTWTVVTDKVASCHYEFRWKGVIDGQEASGGGRGTTILIKTNDRWMIAHEHLGPVPRK